MLLLSPVWLFPQPVHSSLSNVSNVSTQKTQIVVDKQTETGSLQPEQVSQASVKKTSERNKESGKNPSQLRPSHKAVVQKPTSADTGRNNAKSYSKEEVKALIVSYSQQYDINPNTPLCIAEKESGFNHRSANKHSSAKGVFQYLNGTWKATDEGKAGHSVFDAEMNVKAAVKYMASRGNAKPWIVANKCPPVKKIN